MQALETEISLAEKGFLGTYFFSNKNIDVELVRKLDTARSSYADADSQEAGSYISVERRRRDTMS